MDNNQYTRIVIGESRSAPYYSEQEMAESCQVDVQMIRRLRVVGLIEGVTLAGGELRFSEEDIAELRRIRRLHRDLGVNLAGIQVILHLRSRLQALEHELEQYKHPGEQ